MSFGKGGVCVISPHLPLDVSQQAAGSQAEQGRTEPVFTQLLFDESEPHQGLLSRSDPPCWLKAHLKVYVDLG